MARGLTQEEKDRVKEQLFEFLDAAARHGQVCPSTTAIAQRLRRGTYTVENAFRWLIAERRIRVSTKFTAGVGAARIVHIVATGRETVARSMQRLGHAARKLAAYDQTKRVEGQEIDQKLYGPVLEEVNYLRRRGFVINREPSGYRVGNAIVSAAEIVAKAARERRLAGVA